MFIKVCLQVFMVEVGGSFTRTTGLDFTQWMVSIALGAVSLPLGPSLRAVVRVLQVTLSPLRFWWPTATSTGILQRHLPIYEDPDSYAIPPRKDGSSRKIGTTVSPAADDAGAEA